MLYFYCASPDELEAIRQQGIQAGRAPVRLWRSLSDVQVHCSSDRILVIDGFSLRDRSLLDEQSTANGTAAAIGVPVETIQNITPYRTPVPVAAGGGYVLRRTSNGIEVLTIYRRGVWDLPKGKLETGETPKEGALREVKEEVGIDKLELIGSLGTTVHGYVRGGQYQVKTTYWYAMRTPETSFTPQREEQVERAAWMPWAQAREKLGHETLQNHMGDVESAVEELLE